MLHRLLSLAALAGLLVALGHGLAAAPKDADPTAGLKAGTVELKSAGPLAFAPKGVLLVGDPIAAAVYAIDTEDNTAAGTGRPKVEGLDEKIASLLGTEAKGIQVRDLAVNPVSGNTYLSIARGPSPVILKLSRDGKLSEFTLKDRKVARATLPNPVAEAGKGGQAKGKKGRAPSRMDAITEIAYVNGRVLVAGLSNEEFASNLRSIPFPFDATDKGTSIEMYHGAHGAFETRSPIRVFAPYKIGGEDHLLAAYTCTPLVKIPVNKLEPGAKMMATTVAELGNRNQPLSIIVYNKGGKDYALIANSSRGLMKVSLDGVDKIEGITKRVADTAGLKYETVKDVTGVQRLDAFGKDHAVVLLQGSDGAKRLDTIELP